MLVIVLLSSIAISTLHAEIIDHNCTDITQIPQTAIEQAKTDLHIAYGHTSHGSQLTDGMSGLIDFVNGGGLGLSLPTDIFDWNNGGTGGALDLHDYAMGGDCGYYPQWYNNTINYLDDPSHSDVNVIIWSWCGQVDDKYAAGTLASEYLVPMAQLEVDYPAVTFIYMTGHVDHWDDANNKAANQMIRDYCNANDKVLYDFADIESYDPDGTFFEFPHDNCNYYASEYGALLGNWATEWQDSHTVGVDWYNCSSAHSQPLNANLKAYAAWWLWATLAGWDQCLPAPTDLSAIADSEMQEISLSWLDNSNSPNEDSFIIQRRIDGGAWNNNYDTVATDIISYTDTGLTIGTYSYRIVAHLNDDGSGNPCNSGTSNTATATIVNTDPPIAPANVIIIIDSDSVHITWDPVPGCTYNFYSSSDPYDTKPWSDVETGMSDTNWSSPIGEVKNFYYVTAVK